MITDNNGAQPNGIENRAELLRKGDEPKVEAVRRRVDAICADPLLCREASVPAEDARGRITTHRARHH